MYRDLYGHSRKMANTFLRLKENKNVQLNHNRLIYYRANSAFSKRFVGAGHSEEGGGPGGEGTLPSARRACTFRGVRGHSPSEIF